MDEREPPVPETPRDRDDRRRAGRVLLVVLALFVLYDVFYFVQLTRYGSPDDVDHAIDRIGDLSTGPNAP